MKLPPIRVLYVEDDPVDVELVKLALEQACVEVEYTLIVGEHGEHAIDLLRSPDFDIVLLDSHLPRISGLELLRHIRQQPTLRHLPVILLTGANSPKMSEEATELGVNACITKPLEFSSFKSVFRQICEKWFIPIATAKAV